MQRHMNRTGGLFCPDHLHMSAASKAVRGKSTEWAAELKAALTTQRELMGVSQPRHATEGDLDDLEEDADEKAYKQRRALLKAQLKATGAKGHRCVVCAVQFSSDPLGEPMPLDLLAKDASVARALRMGSEEWLASVSMRCAGCHAFAHAGCVGVEPAVAQQALSAKSSDGSGWTCAACAVHSECSAVVCALCPVRNLPLSELAADDTVVMPDALPPAVNHLFAPLIGADGAAAWVHVSCALWSPGALLVSPGMSGLPAGAVPVSPSSRVFARESDVLHALSVPPASSRAVASGVCDLCGNAGGALIACGKDGCGKVYHPPCAINASLHVEHTRIKDSRAHPRTTAVTLYCRYGCACVLPCAVFLWWLPANVTHAHLLAVNSLFHAVPHAFWRPQEPRTLRTVLHLSIHVRQAQVHGGVRLLLRLVPFRLFRRHERRVPWWEQPVVVPRLRYVRPGRPAAVFLLRFWRLPA